MTIEIIERSLNGLVDSPILPAPTKQPLGVRRQTLLGLTGLTPSSYFDAYFQRANRSFSTTSTTSSEHASPTSLFRPGWNYGTMQGIRFIHTTEPRTMLAFTSGACPSTGEAHARGGAACIFAPKSWSAPRKVPLPMDGTTHTTERADILGLLELLTARFWDAEGFNKLIIATDSEFLVTAVTENVYRWRSNGWRKNNRVKIKNVDLWEKVLAGFADCESRGLFVQLWRIPREWNEAVQYAKEAAATPMQQRPSQWVKTVILERYPDGEVPGSLVVRDHSGVFWAHPHVAEHLEQSSNWENALD
ncbi:hypothetical protein BJ508DRAFT_360169 [Ascobolus immersus RN42]|uniref:RNase H type-1 domain-containing protein n=1 Tax=Ascobolus immersus RN42 TaxID=1160509 RepID=A0A3N4II27_ASCIM|nr:hypothetical protein BJ508DRAFT_360169 [Ascobolus immersus RN42]